MLCSMSSSCREGSALPKPDRFLSYQFFKISSVEKSVFSPGNLFKSLRTFDILSSNI